MVGCINALKPPFVDWFEYLHDGKCQLNLLKDSSENQNEKLLANAVQFLNGLITATSYHESRTIHEWWRDETASTRWRQIRRCPFMLYAITAVAVE